MSASPSPYPRRATTPRRDDANASGSWRRGVVALAVGAIILIPNLASAAGGPPTPEFPQAIRDLVAKWTKDAEALGANDTARPWYPEAKRFLDGAKDAAAKGRVRTAMYDLETYTELVLAGEINDTARSLPSDAERKTYALDRATEWKHEATAAWQAYRARLHKLEPDVRTVQGMELALYSGDNALGAALMLTEHDQLARDFQRVAGFDRGYLLAIVRTDHTALLTFQWADDVLDAIASVEGVPPRLEAENWTLIRERALEPVEGEVASHLKPIEAIAKELRAGNESTLAIVANLAEQRADRATSISVIFGDARSRGLNVTRDAAHGMNSQLNNTTMDKPRGYGLAGVFTADAIDRAIFTNEFVAKDQADLGAITAAWAQLDHQGYVAQTLAAASPVSPPPAATTTTTPSVTKPAPGAPPLVLVALAGLAALALRRARRDA